MSANDSCVWRGSLAVLHGEEAVQKFYLHLTFGETFVCLYAYLAGEKVQEDSTTHLLVRMLMRFESTESHSPAQTAGQGSECQVGVFPHTVSVLKREQPQPRYPGTIVLKHWLF